MFRPLLVSVVLMSSLLTAQEAAPTPSPKPTQWASQLPRVQSMDVPFCPPLARAANVSGIVRLKVTTDGQRVKDVQVIEGTRLLAEAADKNVRSWRFYPSDPNTFTVTYSFKFAKPNAKNFQQLVRILPDSEIRSELPTLVEITTAPRPNQGDASPDKR